MTTPVSSRVAAIQMVSTGDIHFNLSEASRMLAEAAAAGASVAVLPENFAIMSSAQMLDYGRLEAGDNAPVRNFLREQSRSLGIWIVGGSLPMARRPDGSALDGRVRSSCLVFDDQGLEVARYDKLHLFDATVDDDHGHYRESATFEPGDQVVTVDTPAGKLGLAICYDLRFPELFRALRAQGADWVCLPSAFTWHTGSAHWHPLIRARAIENQVWVVAAGQGGFNSPRRRTWGHSLICDPWGQVIREIEDGPGWVAADLDAAQLTELRRSMPVWEHRRL